MARLRALALALAGLGISALAEPASAGNRVSGCGGLNDNACAVWQAVPSCDKFLYESVESCGFLCVESICRDTGRGDAGEQACTPYVHHAWPDLCKSGKFAYLGWCYAYDAQGYPSWCGGDAEAACSLDLQLFLGITSCKPGHVEQAGLPVGTCRLVGADGFPVFCGDASEPACTVELQVQLGIPSCKAGNFEWFGTCYAYDTAGYPAWCGDDGETACTLDLQVALGITSCKPNHVEQAGVPVGTCRLVLADGYPAFCGDQSEPACGVDIQVALGVTSCKAGLFEAGFPFAGTCQAPDPDGFPSYCGRDTQPACSIIDQIALGIAPCKAELVEQAGLPVGTCRAIDDEGWPAFCGDQNQTACGIELQDATGNPSCKPGLYEEFGLPLGTCRYTPVPEPGLATTAVVAPTAPGTPVFGIADMHAHPFSNEGFGGRLLHGKPFYKYGVAGALDSCVYDHSAFGLGDLIGNELDNGNMLSGHEVGGYPGLEDWPGHNRGTHQQMYHRWIERAFRGGLRLMVVHAVNNAVICEITEKKLGFGCDDMDAVDRELGRAIEMEAYLDAQSGGPGQGWFRIARSAAEARSIIESGKLAVVLGIEVDSLFRCPVGQCNETHVRSEVARYHAMGVRHLFPVHVFDNAFGGTALYHGAQFNAGNRLVNGQWFQAEDCSASGYEYQEPLSIAEPWLTIFSLLPFALTPAHGPAAAHCNARGLTPLGDTLLRELMAKKMIIDVDHMSSRTLDGALDLAESQAYPVVAGHAEFLDVTQGETRSERRKTGAELDRIRDLGGMVGAILNQGKASELTPYGPIANDCDESAKAWAQGYLYATNRMQGGPGVHGVGIGSDLNGFLHLPAPRFGEKACKGNVAQAALQPAGARVVYPFQAHDGSGSFDRLTTGTRSWDINEDGMANVGLLPDFVQELKVLGLSNADLEPLFRSAEAYLQLWEAVDGTADFDGDGTFDAADSCPTLADAGTDTDMDGVGDACDTCTGKPNPRFAGAAASRTLVSGQLDDDGDGRGNACDFDYDNSGAVITAGDWNQMKVSIARIVSQSTCGAAPTNTQRCGEFDHDGAGAVVTATDFNAAKTAVGKIIASAYPKCAACNPPFSAAPGGAVAAVVGRPVCAGPACAY